MVDRNQAMQQNPAGAVGQSVRISSKEFQAKYNSELEIYNFLATDCGVFLPPFENVTIYFVSPFLFMSLYRCWCS